MEKWKQQLRGLLERNIAGLKNLSAPQKAALLETELKAAVESTESGRGLGGETDQPTAESESQSAEFEEIVTPDAGALRRARARRAAAEKRTALPLELF